MLRVQKVVVRAVYWCREAAVVPVRRGVGGTLDICSGWQGNKRHCGGGGGGKL
jgi:hypothetical protein